MKVTVRTSTSAVARISGQAKASVKVGTQGPPGTSVNEIAEMIDVDLTALQDGCVLVWNATTQKWVAQTLLNKQQIDMGSESY